MMSTTDPALDPWIYLNHSATVGAISSFLVLRLAHPAYRHFLVRNAAYYAIFKSSDLCRVGIVVCGILTFVQFCFQLRRTDWLCPHVGGYTDMLRDIMVDSSKR